MTTKYTLTKIKKNVKKSWLEFFKNNKEKIKNILEKVNKDTEKNVIFPKPKHLLQTFKYFEIDQLKVVFIFQDPYINSEIINNKIIPQAMGLATSVPKGLKIPPTLKNIYKELKYEYPNFKIPEHGNLIRWVEKENILLLNASLTTIQGHSGSHLYLWEKLTDDLIKYISDNTSKVIFVLLGNYAKKKQKFIDLNKHDIISSSHPSPLGARFGFIKSNTFKKINKKLIEFGKEPINWSID